MPCSRRSARDGRVRGQQFIHTGRHLQRTDHCNQWLDNSPIEPFDHH
jgi:hypothetical protein